jgi:hypothetical protein
VGLSIIGGIACWFFPLFRLRTLDAGASASLNQSAIQRQSASAEPAAHSGDLFIGSQRIDGGAEINRLWRAFDADPSKARSQYGRKVGLGGAWYFCIQGQGAVELVEKNRVVLSIAGSPRRACLELGPVVDNTVREAVGVKASDFANSQDFNAISSKINHLVEQDVIAPNRERLKAGVDVEFVGCAKIAGKSDLDPLYMIPVRIAVRDPGPGDADSDAADGVTLP